MEIFSLLSRQGQKQDKKLEIEVFLARLLAPLSFACWSCFYWVLEASALGLTVNLAISRAESITEKLLLVSLSGHDRRC